MRGGEKVVEALCRLLPDADIFTLFYDPERASDVIRSRRVTASYLNPVRRYYRSLLPLMPSALESFDLRGYDRVVSSESGPAKGVLAPSHARHVCYCHTPMRYLWEFYPDYMNDWNRSAVKRAFVRPFARHLRVWDFASAARVDEFVANSENVRRRIWKTYRREATVVHPPVAVQIFQHCPAQDYFLMVSELVPYKRLDYAIRLFTQTGRRLKIAGDGPGFKTLRAQAGASVEFCGRVSDHDLRALYARSRALLVPGEEDFGITMVEALASGKPIIALGRGGVLDIVRPGDSTSGVLYPEPSEEHLSAALLHFEAMEKDIDPNVLQRSAARFSEAVFQEKMGRILEL
jgi:glycosyltransferase involved in cell wall biosynthesis